MTELAVAEQTLVGRKAGGHVAGLTSSEALTLLTGQPFWFTGADGSNPVNLKVQAATGQSTPTFSLYDQDSDPYFEVSQADFTGVENTQNGWMFGAVPTAGLEDYWSLQQANGSSKLASWYVETEADATDHYCLAWLGNQSVHNIELWAGGNESADHNTRITLIANASQTTAALDVQTSGNVSGVQAFASANPISTGVGGAIFAYDPADANGYWSMFGTTNGGGFFGQNVTGAYYVLALATTAVTQLELVANPAQAQEALGIYGGFMEMGEITTPAAPGSGNGRIYMKDVGGKVGLYVRFPSGAEQQIKVEP